MQIFKFLYQGNFSEVYLITNCLFIDLALSRIQFSIFLTLFLSQIISLYLSIYLSISIYLSLSLYICHNSQVNIFGQHFSCKFRYSKFETFITPSIFVLEKS